MKKFRLLLYIFIAFSFYSCSNPQNVNLKSQENTLRNELNNKSEKIIWTTEIDASRLNEEMNTFIKIADKNLISPKLIQSLRDVTPPVYPCIKDFESLDTSGMNTNLYTVVKDFCTKLTDSSDSLDSYFNTNYFFNYVFFKKDLKDIWPVEEDEELFDRFVICKAFENKDIAQVPVRFYKDKEFVDLSLYLAYYGEYKITKIEIIRWGNLNGETEQKQ